MKNLIVRGVSVEKNAQPILHEIHATIPNSKLTVMVGPNGAGKSTLLRSLVGLEQLGTGSVTYGDLDLSTLTVMQRAQLITWLPPAAALPFAFDVKSIVMMGRFPWHGGNPSPHDHQRVAAALHHVQLDKFAHRSIQTLSSGETQKALIARAIAGDAPILLLDEPCANLDMAAALSILGVLKDLVAQGRSIVLTLHDLSLATRFADYGLLIANGRMQAEGPAIFTRVAIEAVFDVRAESVTAPSGIGGWVFSEK